MLLAHHSVEVKFSPAQSVLSEFAGGSLPTANGCERVNWITSHVSASFRRLKSRERIGERGGMERKRYRER